MAVTVKEIEFSNFGKCIEISNGKCDVVITKEIGPRIIRVGLVGKENVMFNDVERTNITWDKTMDEHFYQGAKWINYGGHRLWVSPEKMPDTYFPDDKPVKVEFIENGALFVQPEQTMNGVACSYSVTMDEAGEITVTHFVKNISAEQKRLSPWAITVLNKGGLEIMINNTLETGLLPNRRIVAWPYTSLADERLYLGKDYITLKQKEIDQAFKLGLDLHKGTALYAYKDTVFVKKYEHKMDAEYDDFGVSFETYTNANILEMETIGTVHYLEPGEVATHTEKWYVYENVGTPCRKDEKAIKAFVENYIK